jgi:hypothetical protein
MKIFINPKLVAIKAMLVSTLNKPIQFLNPLEYVNPKCNPTITSNPIGLDSNIPSNNCHANLAVPADKLPVQSASK